MANFGCNLTECLGITEMHPIRVVYQNDSCHCPCVHHIEAGQEQQLHCMIIALSDSNLKVEKLISAGAEFWFL